ncbi:MAG: ShlB/FhaC/HecB family hemolysin secretion/activation protein [Myxococcota bacterium]|nr:ShlB/FhaC/HecB family hemolysin secretion/activation protein [Myxococcota bacterium]
MWTGLALLPTAARAQFEDVRPGDERLELPDFEEAPAPGLGRRPLLELPQIPDFEPPERATDSVLPPLELPAGPDTEGLEAGVRVPLRAVRVRGNTVLREEDLEELVQPYLDRELGFEDLQQLRDDLTLAYVEAGYETSSAVVPSQSLADGVLEVWIIEGRVAEIQVATDGRLRDSYIESRLARAVGPPVNVDRLERALRILQDDEHIRRVNARLLPGERRGEAVLRVEVSEARPWNVRLAGNNYSSPAIGGGRGEVRVSWNNITGFGDMLWAEYKGGVGLQDVRARYEWPLGPWGTKLDIHFRRTWSEVVERPFDDLDIKSQTETYGFRLSQTLYRTPNTTIGAFMIGEWRRSDSFLFDEHFSFVRGADDGVVKIAALRFGAEWSWQTRNQVIAARSMFTQGLPVLGATENSGRGVPDATFLSWLGQLQVARRFPELFDVQVVARGDVQLSDRPLFGLEQFAIGGHATVRGYRENRLVRDSGLVGSVELRVPVPLPSWREWRPTLEIAPFFDVGRSWNKERGELGPRTLMSVGVGGRLGLWEGLDVQVYWGHDLKDVENLGTNTLQDDGVHMGVLWSWP